MVLEYENVDPRATTGDVGLLRLEKPIQFSSKICPICLPTAENLGSISGKDMAGLKGRVAGWGRTNFSLGKAPDELQMTDLTILPFDECQRRLKGKSSCDPR